MSCCLFKSNLNPLTNNTLIISIVKAVEKKAKEMLKTEYPNLTDADLDISMSDKVKKDTERRIQLAGAGARGELWHPGMGVHGGNARRLQGNPNMPQGMGPGGRIPLGMPNVFLVQHHGFPPAMGIGRVMHQGRFPNNNNRFGNDDAFDPFNEFDDEFAAFDGRHGLPQGGRTQQQRRRNPSAVHPVRPQQPQPQTQQQVRPIQRGNQHRQFQANAFQNRSNQQPNVFHGRNNPQPNVFIGRGPAANQVRNAAAQRQGTPAALARAAALERERLAPAQPETTAGPSGTVGGGQTTRGFNARNNVTPSGSKRPGANAFVGRRLGR
jgi:hypothetical protein